MKWVTYALGCTLTWAVAASPAHAFPERPVRLVVPFPAGSTLDKLARQVAERMGEQLKGTVIVDNVAGAGGSIGVEAVVNAQRDGHTLLLGTMGALAINPHTYKQLRYDPLKDLVPIGGVTRTTNVLAVRPGLPVKTVPELIAHAKANPGKLTYGSAGIGSSSHLAAAMLASMASIDLVHVPYKGAAAALPDLIGGRLDLMMDAAGSYLTLTGSGKVNVLAVTSRTRFPKMPDWPNLHDAGVPGYELTVWNAIMAPAGTPPERLEVLRNALQAATSNPSFAAAIAPDEPMRLPIGEFDAYLRAEHARWGKVVKDSGAGASQ